MKKIYIIGIVLILLLALGACVKQKTKDESLNDTIDGYKKDATEAVEDLGKDAKKKLEEYEKDITTWFEKDVINNEDIKAIDQKIEEMKEKIADADVLEKTKEKYEEFINKLEDLKERAKDF